MIYRKNYKKVIYGYVEVEADSIEEADNKFYEQNIYEFDNKSEYEELDDEWEAFPTEDYEEDKGV